jgi:hypothetical protein
MSETRPGTYLVADDAPVDPADAQAAWIPLAREALERTAREYHGVIRYGELAEEVQEKSGIRTRQVVRSWIGDILAGVSRDCQERSEPLLSALCVQQDGTIGAGFGAALVESRGGPEPADLDQAAAEERLECYRYFGAQLPADGGRAALTPEVFKRRNVAARKARAERVRPSCPSCHIALPASGVCEYCA